MLTHIYTVEVDHDFRRWLTAIGKFTYGTLDYQGDNRSDKIYSLSGDLIYKLNRNLWVKGTLRRDWLDSNLPGNSYAVDRRDAGRAAAELTLVRQSVFDGASSAPVRILAAACGGAVIPAIRAAHPSPACPAIPVRQTVNRSFAEHSQRYCLTARGKAANSVGFSQKGDLMAYNKPAHRSRFYHVLWPR